MDKTKEKLLQVATRIFTRFGFHKTTMDEIARTARKAKGSLYYYFNNKEELFKEVVKRELSKIRDELSKVVNSDKTGKEKIHEYILLRMELMRKAFNYHETLRADFYEQFNFLDVMRAEFDSYETEALKKMLNEGIQQKEIKNLENIDIVSEMLMMVLKGLEIPFYLQDKYTYFKEHVDYLLNIVLEGVAYNKSNT